MARLNEQPGNKTVDGFTFFCIREDPTGPASWVADIGGMIAVIQGNSRNSILVATVADRSLSTRFRSADRAMHAAVAEALKMRRGMAIHEAGHAICFIVLRHHTERDMASSFGDEHPFIDLIDSIGHTYMIGLPASGRVRAMIGLAGICAERAASDDPIPILEMLDDERWATSQDCQDALHALSGSGEELKARAIDTAQFAELHLPPILALATELEKRGTLTYTQALQIVQPYLAERHERFRSMSGGPNDER